MQPGDPPFSVGDIDRAPASLPGPPHVDWEEKYHKLKTRFDQVGDETFQLKEELSQLKAQTSTRATLDGLIIPYASRTFWFMCVYCGGVGLMLMLSGFQDLGFRLSDPVLQLLVGSTAVTVIGLVGMVLTGVFVGARSR